MRRITQQNTETIIGCIFRRFIWHFFRRFIRRVTWSLQINTTWVQARYTGTPHCKHPTNLRMFYVSKS